MSRLRRLKEERRKNRLKAASCGLSLALVIGLAQGLGTYALFTDTEDIYSELDISIGDVDVKISDGLDFTDVHPQDKIEIPFVIANKGTLNQNISLKLDISTDIIKYLTHNIVFDDSNIKIEDETLHNGTDLLILSPGQMINGSIHITVGNMSSEVQNILYGKVQNINLEVKSTQINESNTLVNSGFYDIEEQQSTIIIGAQNIIYGDAVKVTPASGYQEESTVELRVSDTTHYSGLNSVIDNINNVDKNHIEVISQNGAFEGTSIFNIGQQWYKFDRHVNTKLITDKFGDNNDISVRLKYNDGSYKIYKFDFKVKEVEEITGNRLLAVKVTLEPDTVDLLKEKIEVPSEPEIVEPPKEEIEVPSEQEVVEQAKEEIIEIPNQQESIEPPKDNEGIQE